MSYILYYSNFCESSRSLLNYLRTSVLQDDIHFMSVDKRVKDKNNTLKIVLENGESVKLPENVNKVPALLLLNRGNRVIFGNDIMKFLTPKEEEATQLSNVNNNYNTNNNIEPEAFSIYEMAGISDTYSYLDMNSDDLSAKGSGGLRTMHSYVPINFQDFIETPPDDYSPDTIGENSIEKLQKSREKEISASY